MNAFVTAGAGFLLAVLWFDLMFDVQAAGRGAVEVPEPALASIAAYYARVTTAARPMNRLIAAVMAATLAAIVVEIAKGDRSGLARLGLARARARRDRAGRRAYGARGGPARHPPRPPRRFRAPSHGPCSHSTSSASRRSRA